MSQPSTLTREQVREFDRRAVEEYGVPSAVLMENAGRGAAETILRLDVPGPVAICCGGGNNGGDGFVIARYLDNAGVAVGVYLCSSPDTLPPDAATNYRIIEKSGLLIVAMPDDDPHVFEGVGIIVDSLLGTGARGAPRAAAAEVIRRINAAGLPVVAIDVPSGLDCDTGEASDPTVRAAHTCTFVAPKPGLLEPAAAAFVGQLHTISIGAPRRLWESMCANEKAPT